ncbi:potassium/proton antiporter [Paenibacillus sp. 1001270B_150601_E10]|uniref:potassium/proton antiporter n=1 Tax=Paenibacillus sp. 1001270B_150601_E10 TaxID=2787079 RepID=UPI00189E1773|nr:potassium/proton antiporter [Paenibacillus sp. 1001270B_150601_E10]
MIWTTDELLFLLGMMLFIGVVGAKMTNKLNVPSLVVFIMLGMGLSQFMYFDNAHWTQLFGILALIIILFEGGMHTSWKRMKLTLKPALSLSTVGVAVTAVVVGVCAKFILNLEWLEGLLVGAIVGSTDAAAIFSVIGGKAIHRQLKTTLEVESGSNDPMAVFLTLLLIGLMEAPESVSWLYMLSFFVWQMGAGLLLGLFFGLTSARLLNRIQLSNVGLYPVLAVSLGILTYSIAALMECSGFLAVYVMAIMLGNADLTYRYSIVRFNEGFSWMMQIMMFVLLGLLVFPGQLVLVTWQALLLSFILMFIARPIGVWLSLLFSRFNTREKVLISWAGLKGAVPIILATFPLTANVEHGMLFFNVVFFVVLSSALLQGATVSWVADKLGLSQGNMMEDDDYIGRIQEPRSVSESNLNVISLKVWPRSQVEYRRLAEIRLPGNTSIMAIMREMKEVPVYGESMLHAGDVVYLLAAKEHVNILQRMFVRQQRIKK